MASGEDTGPAHRSGDSACIDSEEPAESARCVSRSGEEPPAADGTGLVLDLVQRVPSGIRRCRRSPGTSSSPDPATVEMEDVLGRAARDQPSTTSCRSIPSSAASSEAVGGVAEALRTAPRWRRRAAGEQLLESARHLDRSVSCHGSAGAPLSHDGRNRIGGRSPNRHRRQSVDRVDQTDTRYLDQIVAGFAGLRSGARCDLPAAEQRCTIFSR